MYYDPEPYKEKNKLLPIVGLFAVAIIVGLLGFGRTNDEMPENTDSTEYSQGSTETEET